MRDRVKLKAGSSTKPQTLAGAIVKTFVNDKEEEVEVIAVGAGANQQATKALILARRYISSSGDDLRFIPAFDDVEISGKTYTAIKWIIRRV